MNKSYLKKLYFLITLMVFLSMNVIISYSNGVFNINYSNLKALNEPEYTGFFTVGPCSGNCIGSGTYCWQCQRSLTQHECTPSNPYCASN